MRLKTLLEADKPEKAELQGTVNKELFKKLLGADFDDMSFNEIITGIKTGKPLSIRAKTFAANFLLALIKTSDDAMVSKIMSNLKNINTK